MDILEKAGNIVKKKSNSELIYNKNILMVLKYSNK